MTGSVIAWAKLDGRMDRRFNFPGQQVFNFLILGAAIVAGIALIAWQISPWLIIWNTAPCMPCSLPEKMPSVTKPMCATDE